MVALILVTLSRITLLAAAPPTLTDAVVPKFVPVSVMTVPPPVGPEFGATTVSVTVTGMMGTL